MGDRPSSTAQGRGAMMYIALPDQLVVTAPAREVLTEQLRISRPHLHSIMRAIRDEGCAHIMVAQHAVPFPIPLDGPPTIAVIGDDMDTSLGPYAFHRKSLRRLVKAAHCAVIMVGLSVDAYHQAASWAVLKRQHVVIVETRSAHEMIWVNYLRDLNPNLAVMVVMDQSEKPNA